MNKIGKWFFPEFIINLISKQALILIYFQILSYVILAILTFKFNDSNKDAIFFIVPILFTYISDHTYIYFSSSNNFESETITKESNIIRVINVVALSIIGIILLIKLFLGAILNNIFISSFLLIIIVIASRYLVINLVKSFLQDTDKQ